MKRPLLLLLAGLGALPSCVSTEPEPMGSSADGTFALPSEGVDHVLIWTRDVDQDIAALRDKLGFHIGPRFSFPDQVANRVSYFRDQSFLELLHFTVPLQQLAPRQVEGVEFLTERDGSNGFGIRVSSLEERSARLASGGIALGEPSPANSDPDGPDGPSPPEPNPFRILEFRDSPLPGLKPFFVSYAPWPTEAPEYRAVWEATTTHPNTAQRLSAVWIIGPDFTATKAGLRRLGFSQSRIVRMPHLGATGTLFSGGRSAVIVVEPTGPGHAADSLQLRGAHVLGVSIEVSDLALAEAAARRGYQDTSGPYNGGFGRSILAPATQDLGIFIEFHRSAY